MRSEEELKKMIDYGIKWSHLLEDCGFEDASNLVETLIKLMDWILEEDKE